MVAEQTKKKQIFNTAAEITDPAKRATYLDGVCIGDPQLRAEIDDLLRHDIEAGSFLEAPAVDFAAVAPTIDQHPPEQIGTYIGPYKLIEEIGEGGMGSVFMAVQKKPVCRKVALKVIKPGMDSKQVVSRFEAERQALAMMDHPSIARVIDGGSTESGRPYFVMELVRGVPITDYCDKHKFTTKERLELFGDVCQAVQHAHQKGIIHRDLKPSNIMVTLYNGKPVPKVIDFGVAKATSGQLSEATLVTNYAQMIGTPLYMSPEQATLTSQDIDTRSDVYSLGVLLYELLTGTTPLERERVSELPFDELRRIIREEEPPRPSARLSTLNAALDTALETAAENRHADRRTLSGQLSGELDWIVMKALEKDRTRRYDSAAGLARDVQRYLDDEPVEACPPSKIYRLRKFVRRNRTALMAVSAVALVLILGLVGTTWQSIRATRESNRAMLALEGEQRQRERAEANFQIAREAVDRMFTRAARELADKPHMEKIRRALLEDALEFYQSFLKQKGDDPTIRQETARAYLRVGKICLELGDIAEAEKTQKKGIEDLRALSNEYPSNVSYRLDLAYGLGVLAYRNRGARGGVLFRQQSVTLYEQLTIDYPDEPRYLAALADAQTGLGNAFGATGRQKNSEKFLRESLTTWKKLEETFPEYTYSIDARANSYHWLGALLLRKLRIAEAEPLLRCAMQLREKLVSDHPLRSGYRANLAHIKHYYGTVRRHQGKLDETIKLYGQAIELRKRVLDDFPSTLEHRRRLANIYESLSDALSLSGKQQESLEAARKSLVHFEYWAENRPESERVGQAHYKIGLALYELGQTSEASEEFHIAQRSLQECIKHTPEHYDAMFSLALQYGTCPLHQFRDGKRAVELAKACVQHRSETSLYWYGLAAAHLEAGNWSDVIITLKQSNRPAKRILDTSGILGL